MHGWAAYIAASLALVSSHAALSAPGARPWLRARFGRVGFYALYSAVSMLALAAFALAFIAADPGPTLFVPQWPARLAAALLMPLAVLGVITRLTTPARRGDALLPPVGIYRVTRAPGSLAVLLWAGLHMLNMGDARRLTAFAAMALIAVVAIVKNEFVLARSDDPLAPAWRARTALVPMMARQGPAAARTLAEIGWLRLGATLLAYAAALALHPYVIGPDPLLGIFQ